jgi:hypothetical protein
MAVSGPHRAEVRERGGCERSVSELSDDEMLGGLPELGLPLRPGFVASRAR